jgi:hypothetical protein
MSGEDANRMHRDFGALQAEVSNLKAEVTALREVVTDLLALLNQAKGAKWALFVVPAAVSGIIAIAAYFGLKFTFGSPT